MAYVEHAEQPILISAHNNLTVRGVQAAHLPWASHLVLQLAMISKCSKTEEETACRLSLNICTAVCPSLSYRCAETL